MSRSAPAVAVLGAGSWGTALAMQLARTGSRVLLWGRDAQLISQLNATGRNPRYFPDLELPKGIRATADLSEAVREAGQVLIVLPSRAFGDILRAVGPALRRGQGVSWACKGFEPGSGRLLHEVAGEALPGDTPLAVVTGPSFAREVAMDLPTAVTVASENGRHAGRIARLLHGGNFRAYTTTDIVGAELGGAVKNVLAVATGICDAMELGDNARAALVTRGLAEMMRLGRAMGARAETLMGLAGMGDLVLTCTSVQSRNRRLGLELGRGRSLSGALAEIGQVVEGVGAAAEVWRLAQTHEISMPISHQVHGIIHEGWDPEEGVRRLLARARRPEHEE